MLLLRETLLLSGEARLPVRFSSHQEHQVHQHQERLGPGLSLDALLHSIGRGELRPLAGEKGISSGKLNNKGLGFMELIRTLSVNIMERVLLTTWEASLNRST